MLKLQRGQDKVRALARVTTHSKLGEEIEESLKRDPANFKENSGARLLPNVLENLKNCDIGLKIQLKMLDFMGSVN